MQVEAAGLALAGAALVGEVVPAPRQRAQEAVEAAARGQAAPAAEAQVPLAHHVGDVAGLPQALGQGGVARGQAEGLEGPDDRVLEARVDLIPRERERERERGRDFILSIFNNKRI